jgi:hypothetical protein
MSGARSPRPRPAAAVTPTPLETAPSVRSIVNASAAPQCSELLIPELGFLPITTPRPDTGSAWERQRTPIVDPNPTNEAAMLGLIHQWSRR